MTGRPEPSASVATRAPGAGQGGREAPEPVPARASIEARYARHLHTFGGTPAALSDAIVQSMGFCSLHEAYLENLAPEARSIVDARRLLADWRLHDIVERTHFQDAVVQDMIFGARFRCPVCTYLRRFEGRATSMLLGRVERGAMTARRLIDAMPNLEAACHATARAPEPLRHALFLALRRRGRRLVEFAALADGEHGRAGSRIALARAVAHDGASCAAHETEPVASRCPVCRAIHDANAGWLASVRDNFRLAQPLWLTFPGCPAHTRQALVALSDIPTAPIVEHFVDGYLRERPVAEAGGPGSKRKRHRTDWFDAGRAPGGAAASSPWDDARLDISTASCPACRLEDIALRRAVARVVRSRMKSADRTASADLHACCAKHFAEVLIAAPGELAHGWLQERLGAAGVFQVRDAVGIGATQAVSDERWRRREILACLPGTS